ncbi:MAG: caspase family protein, partial [Pirellulaceae bacterium]|nr:caspase family protein [Pirellulaceae bacterium]
MKNTLVWRSRASGIALPVVLMSLCALPSFAAESWQPGKTHAVIIGVCKWKADLTRYSRRHRKDQELRDLLVKRGTPAENITMLLDSRATLVNIRRAIDETLRRTTGESTLLVYYAGHGWQAGDDFCFANYDVRLGPGNRGTAWSMSELASIVAEGFHGQQAIFWGDCCYSGGMQRVVEKLAARKVASFSLTSAATANTSTGNWTFTQSILDGLAGGPLLDTNNDGTITLGELRAEVENAMHHMEGQQSGFYAGGVEDSLVIAETSGEIAQAPQARYPIGSYVRA